MFLSGQVFFSNPNLNKCLFIKRETRGSRRQGKCPKNNLYYFEVFPHNNFVERPCNFNFQEIIYNYNIILTRDPFLHAMLLQLVLLLSNVSNQYLIRVCNCVCSVVTVQCTVVERITGIYHCQHASVCQPYLNMSYPWIPTITIRTFTDTQNIYFNMFCGQSGSAWVQQNVQEAIIIPHIPSFHLCIYQDDKGIFKFWVSY